MAISFSVTTGHHARMGKPDSSPARSLELHALFRDEQANLMRYLTRFRQIACPQDAAQEAFVRVWRYMPADVVSPRAYLYRTAHNVALRHIRRARSAIAVDATIDIEALSRPDRLNWSEDAQIAADVEKLRVVIAALPRLQRLALVLRRLDEMPASEVCRRLNLSERTMQRLVARAIAACRSALKRDNKSDLP